MNSNKKFSNNFEACIFKAKKNILQTINKKNSVSSVTRILRRDLKSHLSDVSKNVACDCNHMRSYTYDNVDSDLSSGKHNKYTQSVAYVGGSLRMLSSEECYCFTSVIRSRTRIYFGFWLRLATDYKSARILRDHNLLKSSLLFWKYEFDYRISLKFANKKATDYHNFNMKLRSLFIWVSYVQRRRKSNKSKSMANANYRLQALQSHMTCWKMKHFLTGESAVEKSLFSAARAHHRRHALRKTLFAWMLRNQFWQQKRTLRNTALKFLHNKLNKSIMVSVIQEWYHQISDIQTSNKHNRYRILKTFLKMWSHRCEVTIIERQMYYSACNLHSISVRRRCFSLWRNYALYKRKKYKQIKFVTRFYKINQIKKYFVAWMNYHFVAADHRSSVQSMNMKRNTSLIKQCLLKWKDYCTIKQELMSKLSHFKKCQKGKLLKEYFQYWLSNLLFKQSQELTIWNFRKQKLMESIKKLFLAWSQWTFSRREYHLKMQLTFKISLENMRIVTIRIWWTRWRSMYNYCSSIKLACRFYNKQILVQCLNCWSAFIIIQKYKIKLIETANDFRIRTIQKQFLRQWHLKLTENRKLQALKSIALVRWSLCLQAKVWKAWHLWIGKQKYKRNRRKIATQRYYEHKTVDSLRLWITVALNKRHERHMKYCSKFWNNDIRVFQLVLNTATRWYWWTFSRGIRQNIRELNASSIWADFSGLTNENRISRLSECGSNFRAIRNRELTPARFPDFIIPELNSLGLTNTAEFEQTSVHVPPLIETFHHETTNCPDIHSCVYSFSNPPDVHEINLYLDSLVERISYYRMIKSKYKLIHQRLYLEGQTEIKATYNEEGSADVYFKYQLKMEKDTCNLLIKQLRSFFVQLSKST
ncbi:unnamed protein product [Schistosoma rodhaini]|uniref:Sfi1 spindle body domain-containing protein n=2 Tax=Schistosoma rodhaini TaxID=6188 RepID=A0AA85FJZ4_9TREM|nr:unnamed protein product [Schistosoma rodhaini]